MQFKLFYSENLTLKVDTEGKFCYLKINNQNNDKAIREKELLILLEKANVVYGFENAKKTGTQNNDFFLIACADNSFTELTPDFLFNIPQKEKIDADSLLKLPFVKKHQKIASLISASHTSFNIFGRPNISKQTLNIQTDDNFKISNSDIITLNKGYIYLDLTEKLNLLTQFTEEKDVFKKKLIIKIKSKFKKDIISSQIESEDDITILGSIRDSKKIYSQKDIYFSSAIDSTIISKGNIYFNGKITDSKLIAGGKIIATKNSKVISGNLIAAHSIDLYDVQNKPKTSLEISLAPVEKELLRMVKKNESEFFKTKQLLNEIEKQFYNVGNFNTKPYIKVMNSIAPNVYLRIYNRSLNIKKRTTNLNFL